MQAWAGKCSEKYWSEEKLKNNGCFIFYLRFTFKD